MRLVALEVEGFRGWVDRQRVDLDADVVLIEGPNGTGKTSLCDAILWALTGELPRLGAEHSGDVVSMYGDGMARVCLELRASSGDALVVTRSTDGAASRLHVSTPEDEWQDDAATQQLVRCPWPEGLRTTDSSSMATSLARTAYLQQDEIRRFIEADSDSDRFEVVADLVGASRYTALQQQLESQRMAWSRQTTERKEDLDRVASEIAMLEAQIQSLAESSVTPTGWLEWRDALGSIPSLEPVPEDAGSPRSPEALDAALRQLDELSRANRRKIDRALQVQAELGVALATPSPSEAAIKVARQSAEDSRREVAQLQVELTAAEQAASAERDALTRIAGQQREMHSLATIALRHLGDRCPVCDQDIVLARVRERLQAMMAPEAGQAPAPAAQRLSEAAVGLKAAELRQSQADAALRSLTAQSSSRQRTITAASAELNELGLPEYGEGSDQALSGLLAREQQALHALAGLRATGEHLALQLAAAAEYRRRSELERALAEAKVSQALSIKETAARDATYRLASAVIEGLREATGELVAKRAAAIGPSLDRIYARVDPHPGFKSVQLISRVWNKRGRLDTEIRDSVKGLHSTAPHIVLSSSQLNALALSVFLALNLGVSRPPLEAVLLDDPIQSLDDVNLLGVMDLLRRYKARRQLVVSTHDRRFASLLQRKLRPATPTGSLALVRLVEWTRSGPILQQATIRSADSPWRIVRQGGL